MSDMLAVLLGAGGGAGSKVIAALSGGKLDAKGIPGQAGGEDPFMAVLFSKLNPAEGQAVQSSELADVASSLPEDLSDVLAGKGADGKEQMPLKPLEQALLAAQWPPGDAGGLAGQMPQAALVVPVALGQTPASTMSVEPEGADTGLEGLGFSSEMAADKDAKKAVPAKSMGVGAAVSMAANTKSGAAEAAADGQLLPLGRGGVELPQQSRPEVSQAAVPTATASTVVQGLATQFQAAGIEAVGVVSGQASQAMAASVGHGMGAMADMQGRTAAGGVQLSIDVPVRSPMFSQELGDRIVWLSARQGQVADIALNPPHLGPLEVKLTLSGGEAGAQFFSPHAQVRDAIEAALPRLREMLADAGVTLGQAQVRDEAFSRQDSLAQGEGRGNTGSAEEDEQLLQAGGLGRTGARSLGQGLVDVFA